MKFEIERRFLVSSTDLPEIKQLTAESFLISQGYLTERGSKNVIRVRIQDPEINAPTPAQAWITVKGRSSGIKCPEFEYQIPVVDALDLLSLCDTTVTKIRHRILVKNHTIEVDEFLGELSGLIIAEVELDHEDEAFQQPAWLGKEISGDHRFSNVALSYLDKSQLQGLIDHE